MPIAQINDINYYYEIHGQADPLICIPGFSADHQIFATILEPLKQHHQVILVDNRGIGKTDITDAPYSIELFAKDIIALMDHLQLKQANLLGHSMGGIITQYIAAYYPDRVKRIVISNSTAKICVRALLLFQFNRKMLMQEITAADLFENVMPWAFSQSYLTAGKNVEFLRLMNVANPPKVSLLGFENQYAALEQIDLSDELKKIKAESLVISGDDDLITPLSESKFIADQIAHSELCIIEQTGHMSMLEKPKEFSDRVNKFLIQ